MAGSTMFWCFVGGPRDGGAPTRCDARLACEAVHLTTGLTARKTCVPSNITRARPRAAPKRCYCRIDAAGLPGWVRVQNGRTGASPLTDKHHYLRVRGPTKLRVSGYATSSTGPEDEPRLRWRRRRAARRFGGFEAYPISSTESFSLSRGHSRRQRGRAREGPSVCLNATLSAESETETRVTVLATVEVPSGERDRSVRVEVVAKTSRIAAWPRLPPRVRKLV